MDALLMGTIITSGVSGLSAIVTTWIQQRTANQKLKEQSRQVQLLKLPPGSHVVDLGRRGVVIDIGERANKSKDSV